VEVVPKEEPKKEIIEEEEDKEEEVDDGFDREFYNKQFYRFLPVVTLLTILIIRK
jgi:hypothetical protein